MLLDKFYLALGKFLYSLSISDGEVNKKETRAIDIFLRNEGGKFSESEEPDDTAFLILAKLSFFNAEKEKLSVSEARKDFLELLKANKGKIAERNLELASSLIERVVAAYGGISEEEKKLVDEIRPYLKNEPS